MSKYVCEKCGHKGHGAPVEAIDGWEKLVSPELAAKLKKEKFRVTRGPTLDENLQLSVPFTTLFISTSRKLGWTDDAESIVKEIYREEIAPVLEKINQNFEILGAIALPSSIDLAITDLTKPVCVFTFVTVLERADHGQKLKDLGLRSLTNEGSVDTLHGWEWLNG